jgi:hypothetical protein
MTTHLPAETRVVNTEDGEPGTLLNGATHDPERGWVEYEVATQYGIERWRIEHIALLDELATE